MLLSLGLSVLMLFGSLSVPPASAQTATDPIYLAVSTTGPVPTGVTGFLVTTSCTNGNSVWNSTIGYPPGGGEATPVFLANLTDCFVSGSTMGSLTVSPLAPSILVWNGSQYLSISPGTQSGSFVSARFTRTPAQRLLINWEFPQVTVTKSFRGLLAEPIPGHTYQYSISCQNGSDVVTTTSGAPSLTFGLVMHSSRVFGMADFPQLRTSSECVVQETDSGGYNPVLLASSQVSPTVRRVGAVSPTVRAWRGLVTSVNVAYGQLAVQMTDESQAGAVSFAAQCIGLAAGMSNPSFSLTLNPGQTWLSGQILEGLTCTVHAPNVPQGYSALRTVAGNVAPGPDGSVTIVVVSPPCPAPASGPSVTSGSVVPQCSNTIFQSVVRDTVVTLPAPKRAIDTRSVGYAKVSASVPVTYSMRYPVAVPSDANAVVLNVTSVSPEAPGWVTLYPCGEAVPETANLTYSSNEIASALAIVRLDSNDRFCAFSSARTHLVLDVVGYTWSAQQLNLLTPAQRLYDSRSFGSTVDGNGRATGRRAAGSTTVVRVGGRGGFPSGVPAAALNITAVSPSGSGFLTVYPCGSQRPNTANLTYAANQTIGNLAVVWHSQGDDQSVCVYTHAEVDLVVDVVAAPGYFPALFPARRLMDTRSVGETVDGLFQAEGERTTGSVTELQVAGRPGVPQSLGVPQQFDGPIVLNVTAVGPSSGGWITVYACGQPTPFVSSLYASAGEIRGNSVISRVSPTGKICIYTSSPMHVVVDIYGYFIGP